jgi:hypothetical protein
MNDGESHEAENVRAKNALPFRDKCGDLRTPPASEAVALPLQSLRPVAFDEPSTKGPIPMTPTPELIEALAQASGNYSDDDWAEMVASADGFDELTVTNARAIARNILASPAALAALTSVNQWRGIADAPRDGTRVLAIDPARGYCAVVVREGPEWAICNEHGTSLGIGFYPTAWMPLPDPPKE